MSQQLTELKTQLDQLKAELGVAQIRRNEVMGTLKNSYGIQTVKEAEGEHTKLTTKTIPTLEAKRDNLIAKAQEVLNGLNTETETGGHPGKQAGPAGSINSKGPAQGRTLVGRGRTDNRA